LKKLLRGDFDKIVLNDEVSRQGRAIGALYVLKDIAKKIGLDGVLGRTRQGRFALLLIYARLMIRGSRLKAVRWAQEESIEEVLGIEGVNEDDLYEVLDWLSTNQEKIEKKLFHHRHTTPPVLFLYDVTSSYSEGTQNEHGYTETRATVKITQEDNCSTISERTCQKPRL